MLKNKTIQESLFFFVSGGALLFFVLKENKKTFTEQSALEWFMSPALFPAIISVFLLFISVALFAETLHKKRVNDENTATVNSKSVFVSIIIVFIYFLLLKVLGFILSTVIFIAALTYYLKERRYWIIALLAFCGAVLIYAVFYIALGTMLP